MSQNSTALVEQKVDIPVPHGHGGRVGLGGLQGFSQGQGSTAFLGADHADTPVPQGRGSFGGPQGFFPSPSGASSSHSPGAVDEAFTKVFRTFPQNKKSAKSGSRSSQRVPVSFGPSTPAPQQRVRLMQWVMIMNEHGFYFWNMDTGEKRWQMEEGSQPRWWLRDGQYVDLGDN